MTPALAVVRLQREAHMRTTLAILALTLAILATPACRDGGDEPEECAAEEEQWFCCHNAPEAGTGVVQCIVSTYCPPGDPAGCYDDRRLYLSSNHESLRDAVERWSAEPCHLENEDLCSCGAWVLADCD